MRVSDWDSWAWRSIHARFDKLGSRNEAGRLSYCPVTSYRGRSRVNTTVIAFEACAAEQCRRDDDSSISDSVVISYSLGALSCKILLQAGKSPDSLRKWLKPGRMRPKEEGRRREEGSWGAGLHRVCRGAFTWHDAATSPCSRTSSTPRLHSSLVKPLISRLRLPLRIRPFGRRPAG